MTTRTTIQYKVSAHDTSGPAVSADWRCTCCGKLLGRRHGSAILVQFARGHRYRISRPASAVCRSCDTLNET
ncbi:hypothetical protein FIU85_02000 [Roseovarius sp. THAF8]|uniref:hypothetical protein n=1 Tax=Roseovarius sp. THAF8 TaxID=2587846 RepID=UPI0012685D2D|nr:hypothetical protein [Roseovarius sp. THAF8]QFT96066.1 hypothetical protein FIU85_02000 [Roseovarius sp. THAF8]